MIILFNNKKQSVVYVIKENTPKKNEIPVPVYTRKMTEFRNIGYLSNSKKTIIPLYGKQVYIGSSNWHYYITQDYVKVPLFIEKRDCMDTIGCKELYHNDVVYLDSYQDHFKVYLYNSHTYY